MPWLRPELVGTWREIALVLLLLVAPFVFGSALAAHHGSSSHYFDVFVSDRKLLVNLTAESGFLGLGLVFLKRRGWQPSDLRIRPSLGSTAQGVALWPLTQMVNAVLVLILFWLGFLAQHKYLLFTDYLSAHVPKLSEMRVDAGWLVILVSMIVNAFLEEIGCTAYAFNQLAAKRGPLFALGLVVPMRMLCHTYQGFAHMMGVGTLFLIYGLVYWRTRNLWTLIFAHALLDIGNIGLLKMATH